MNRDFYCPSCEGQLRIKDSIVLAVQTSSGNRGLIFLSPEIGDYTVIKHPNFSYQEGERSKFFCPVCHANLIASNVNPNLARLMMEDENGKAEVYFSVIAGEKSTYKIVNEKVEAYGADCNAYRNFLGVGMHGDF